MSQRHSVRTPAQRRLARSWLGRSRLQCMRVAGALAVGLCLASAPLSLAWAEDRCGDPAVLCPVAGGAYRAWIPPGIDRSAPGGALIWFHGWQSSAAAVLRDAGLRAIAGRERLVLVAPEGIDKTWSFPGSPSRHRDEVAFARAVLADLAQTLPVDPQRIVVGGFSMGGSMAWTVACEASAPVRGFVPVAGAFWEPLPRACPAPSRPMVHIHGTDDSVVPMAGRPIGQASHQGDVLDSVAVLTGGGAAHCAPPQAAALGDGLPGPLTCRATVCGQAPALVMCLHPGGHSIRPEWVAMGVAAVLAPQPSLIE